MSRRAAPRDRLSGTTASAPSGGGRGVERRASVRWPAASSRQAIPQCGRLRTSDERAGNREQVIIEPVIEALRAMIGLERRKVVHKQPALLARQGAQALVQRSFLPHALLVGNRQSP